MTTQLRTGQAARFLNVSISTLARWRMKGIGPTYSKSGPRIVLYEENELIAYLRSRRQNSTSETTNEAAQ